MPEHDYWIDPHLEYICKIINTLTLDKFQQIIKDTLENREIRL